MVLTTQQKVIPIMALLCADFKSIVKLAIFAHHTSLFHCMKLLFHFNFRLTYAKFYDKLGWIRRHKGC